MADRWLKWMAKTAWLGNVLFEKREEWMEAEPAFVDLDPRRYRLGPNKKPWRIPGRGDNYDPDKVLKEIENRLRGKLVWTFMDDGHNPDEQLDQSDLYGHTNRCWDDGNTPTPHTPVQQRAKGFLAISIHVRFLRVLLNPRSTLAERCLARFAMAETVDSRLSSGI